MSRKSVFLSKTVWLQIAALLSLLVPAVRTWLDDNPVEFVSALAALNVLARWLTSSAVEVFPAEPSEGDGPGKNSGATTMGWVAAVGLGGGALVATPPACTPAQMAELRRMPIQACVTRDGAKICYSSTGGLVAEIEVAEIEVDQESGK